MKSCSEAHREIEWMAIHKIHRNRVKPLHASYAPPPAENFIGFTASRVGGLAL